jgi:hypothetical protein
MEADLRMKEAALDRVGDPGARRGRFRPSADLVRFLDSL